MYRYKHGDPCPLCGAPIPGSARAEDLQMLSILAKQLHIAPPPGAAAEIYCKIAAELCQGKLHRDRRCCRECREYKTCEARCLNHPRRCNLSLMDEVPESQVWTYESPAVNHE